ncbi:MAG: hypothetical protein US76_03395 [Parcubacteria group bacterium GW2011_GWA2_38_13b]|nr:MAG: hypothetical protein US76_03395 [Parcubacteria group bacterium GW2011_GWA2_38_13b]
MENEIFSNFNTEEKKEFSFFEIEKQKKMYNLKDKLKELDKIKEIRWDDIKNRIIFKYDKKGEYGKNFICDYKGKEYKLSLGDVMADYNWGVKYMPDSEMPEDVYRKISKRILANEARRDIEDIYDKEIIKSQLSAGERKGAIANKSVKSDIDFGKEIKSEDVGMISEEMVREFMTRLSYGISKIIDLEIKIVRPNIKEDVRQKIDFKIVIFSHKRGVKTVDEDEMEKNIRQFQRLGFQLATKGGNAGWNGLLEYKEKQIERVKNRGISNLGVDDIILIGLTTKHSKDLYDLWLSMGKPPGGPEKLWDIEQKKRVFRGITEKLKLDIPDGTLEKILK